MIGRVLRELERRSRAPLEVPPWYSKDHILLASYPKSGNTWVRFILGNLSRLLGGHSADVDFHSVAQYVPEIRRNRKLDDRIETPDFPLFLKTHFPWIPAFGRYRSVVIARDPADALVSHYRHLSKGSGKRLPELDRFVTHWRHGCSAWRDWHAGWLPRTDVLIRYEDLLESPGGEMRRMLEALDVDVDPSLVDEAVAHSSKDRMRDAQARRGDPNLRDPNFRFVGKASYGTAREVLDREHLDRIYRCTGAISRKLGYGSGEVHALEKRE